MAHVAPTAREGRSTQIEVWARVASCVRSCVHCARTLCSSRRRLATSAAPVLSLIKCLRNIKSRGEIAFRVFMRSRPRSMRALFNAACNCGRRLTTAMLLRVGGGDGCRGWCCCWCDSAGDGAGDGTAAGCCAAAVVGRHACPENRQLENNLWHRSHRLWPAGTSASCDNASSGALGAFRTILYIAGDGEHDDISKEIFARGDVTSDPCRF